MHRPEGVCAIARIVIGAIVILIVVYLLLRFVSC